MLELFACSPLTAFSAGESGAAVPAAVSAWLWHLSADADPPQYWHADIGLQIINFSAVARVYLSAKRLKLHAAGCAHRSALVHNSAQLPPATILGRWALQNFDEVYVLSVPDVHHSAG